VTGIFQEYAAFYDLLYRSKDYAREARYVGKLIERSKPGAHRILEFGSGTGRHGRELATMGFAVHGIDRSADMVAAAEWLESAGSGDGSFRCQVGDLCTTELPQRFDAVISLFHVMSYQATNDRLLAAFANAARHLVPGGVFVFDVWHGPAVLAQQPVERVKQAEDEDRRVTRRAHPMLDTNTGTVTVRYDISCEDKRSREIARFSEEHLMRYLFPTEVDLFAQSSGLRRVFAEEWLTGRSPSPESWGVTYVLLKVS
jgi:SAM-dependent methyltransferase